MGVLDEHGERITEGLKSVEQGPGTIVFAALDERLSDHGGAYLEDADVAEVVDVEGRVTHGVRPWAVEPVFAERLWDLSERLTGVSFATN